MGPSGLQLGFIVPPQAERSGPGDTGEGGPLPRLSTRLPRPGPFDAVQSLLRKVACTQSPPSPALWGPRGGHRFVHSPGPGVLPDRGRTLFSLINWHGN